VIAPVTQPVRDNYMTNFVGNVTASGYASDPRVISWTTVMNAANADASDFIFYIKPSVETYWRGPYSHSASSTTAFNSSQTFTDTVTLTNVGQATAFDIIFRVVYKDGSVSSKQVRFPFNVTSPYATYPYNFFYGSNNISAVLENTSNYTPTLTPPGYVGTAASITMGIVSTQFKNTNGILLSLNPPATADRTYWYGQTIRYRPFTPGSNPAYTTLLDKTTTPIIDGTIPVIISPITFDQKYEIVVTPYVQVSGTKRDSDYSWYGVGYVNNASTSQIFPADGNWNFNFNWQNMTTNTALQSLATAFAPPVMADATVTLTKFNTYLGNGSYFQTYFDRGSYFELANYHTLEFSGSGITNYKGVRIYRRQATGTAVEVVPGNAYTQARYYGWGQWEYVDTTATKVNLRGPTSSAEFNSYYEVTYFTDVVSQGRNLNLKNKNPTTGVYDGTLQNNNKIQIVDAASGYSNAGTLTGAGQQFLIVVQFNDNSFSTKGLLVNVQSPGSVNAYNQLSPNRPQTVSISAYNNYASGYLRNLSEARSTLSAGQIAINVSVPTSSSGNGTITKALQYPTTDSTNGGAITPAIQ
jgi:hypothetical protein